MTGHIRSTLSFRAVNRPGDAAYDAGLQRHHILPRQLLRRRSLAAMLEALGAERTGFHDFRRNGMLLPASRVAARRIGLPLHRGPHRHYNEMVIERVGRIEAAWSARRGRAASLADTDALARLDLLQRALRRLLLDPRRIGALPLNRHDPALDFSHLDRMADALWGATQWG
ncbi:AHH domain-containing protein [Novosphingobium sp. ZN18A2]|uniref:AHH domain-containing protein n=1 Tax=Novosphingobium sp. ZN18A2 TaxID=3079861 RepID=UPI0030CFB894